MRTLLAILVVVASCGAALSLSAQEPPESVAAYFRDRVSRGRPGVAVNRVHHTPTPGVFAAELQNGWLTHTFRVRGAEAKETLEVPALGAEAVEHELTAFVALNPADRASLATVLTTLGVTLEEVYEPPSAPYFTNGRGIFFDRRRDRYLLVVRGVRDRSLNRCFKAALDVSTAEVLSNVDVACVME